MWGRVWATVQKEFIQLWRNRLVLPALILGVPLEMLLFGAAIRTDVQHIPMAVADQSLSAESRSYLNAFIVSDSFDIVSTVASQDDVVRAIDSGQASLGLVIPPDFADRVRAHDAKVLLVVDGSDSFVSQSASQSATAISQQYAISLTRLQAPVLNTHLKILYNPDLQDLWFVIPGFGAFLLYGISLKLTAFAIVREREVGTIEALLVTPLRPIELMLAKTVPNLCLGVFLAAINLPIGALLYNIPFRGSLILYAFLSILFAISGLGLGLAISTVSQSQLQAQQVSTLLNIGAMFLSGFMFPVYALPVFLRVLGYILPLTFFMPIVNGIIIKGVGLQDLWAPALAMAVLSIAIFFAGARFFRQNMD